MITGIAINANIAKANLQLVVDKSNIFSLFPPPSDFVITGFTAFSILFENTKSWPFN